MWALMSAMTDPSGSLEVIRCLRHAAVYAPSLLAWSALQPVVHSLLERLPATVAAGEDATIAHARRLTTALQVSGACGCCATILPPLFSSPDGARWWRFLLFVRAMLRDAGFWQQSVTLEMDPCNGTAEVAASRLGQHLGSNPDELPSHANLSTGVQVSPAEDAAAALLANAGHRAALCSALQRCFAFDRAAAPLLLYSAGHEGGGNYSNANLALPMSASPSADSRQAASGGSAALPPNGTADAPAIAAAAAENGAVAMHASLEGSADAADASSGAGLYPALAASVASAPAALLPRMPAGLLYVATARAYEALARIPRTIGRLAATADAANPGGQHRAPLWHARRW